MKKEKKFVEEQNIHKVSKYLLTKYLITKGKMVTSQWINVNKILNKVKCDVSHL
jgi:hypothetical protein